MHRSPFPRLWCLLWTTTSCVATSRDATGPHRSKSEVVGWWCRTRVLTRNLVDEFDVISLFGPKISIFLWSVTTGEKSQSSSKLCIRKRGSSCKDLDPGRERLQMDGIGGVSIYGARCLRACRGVPGKRLCESGSLKVRDTSKGESYKSFWKRSRSTKAGRRKKIRENGAENKIREAGTMRVEEKLGCGCCTTVINSIST